MKVACLVALSLFLVQCGHTRSLGEDTSSNQSIYQETGWDQPAVRIVFHKDNFTDLGDFETSKHTQYRCLGDATRVYLADSGDYSGGLTSFWSAPDPDDFTVTTHPAFLKQVSVDMTQTYFALTQSGIVQTDQCSYRGIASTAGPSSCADFDTAPPAAPTPTIAPTATPNPTPIPTTTPSTTEYYDSGYYRVRDDWCTGQGPIISPNPETTKSFVGGVSIDLDRNALGVNEDLLMVVTYHSLNSNASWPGAQLTNDHTVMKVNLVGTALSLDSLLQVKQPRAWSFYDQSAVPVYWREVASLEDPFGSLRSEQVYLPLSKNGLIDRVRIERVRGSFHLYQVDLYRLGNRAQ